MGSTHDSALTESPFPKAVNEESPPEVGFLADRTDPERSPDVLSILSEMDPFLNSEHALVPVFGGVDLGINSCHFERSLQKIYLLLAIVKVQGALTCSSQTSVE